MPDSNQPTERITTTEPDPTLVFADGEFTIHDCHDGTFVASFALSLGPAVTHHLTAEAARMARAALLPMGTQLPGAPVGVVVRLAPALALVGGGFEPPEAA